MRVSSYRSKRRISRVGPAPRRIKEIALRPRPVKKATVDPELVQRWERVIGRSRALRAYRTYQEMLRKGEVGTLPEILTYGWLQGRPHLFDFQSSLLGGRLIMGGAVADFIIYDISPDGLVIWRVQGDHWHSMPDRIAEGTSVAGALHEHARRAGGRYLGVEHLLPVPGSVRGRRGGC